MAPVSLTDTTQTLDRESVDGPAVRIVSAPTADDQSFARRPHRTPARGPLPAWQTGMLRHQPLPVWQTGALRRQPLPAWQTGWALA